jgi:hypothetical protein
VQSQLTDLQQQLGDAQASYAAAQSQASAILAAASPADLETAQEQAQQILNAALLTLSNAQSAIDQAKQVPSTQGVVTLDKGLPNTAQSNAISSIRALANSDPVSYASQIQIYTQSTQEQTTNTVSDLATIASAFTQDTNQWLNAALNGTPLFLFIFVFFPYISLFVLFLHFPIRSFLTFPYWFQGSTSSPSVPLAPTLVLCCRQTNLRRPARCGIPPPFRIALTASLCRGVRERGGVGSGPGDLPHLPSSVLHPLVCFSLYFFLLNIFLLYHSFIHF